jgi:hypothetical protein
MFRCCYSISVLDSIIPPQNHPFIPPELIEVTPIPSTAASSTTTTPPPSPPPEEESDPTPSETYTNLSIKTPQDLDFSDTSE